MFYKVTGPQNRVESCEMAINSISPTSANGAIPESIEVPMDSTVETSGLNMTFPSYAMPDVHVLHMAL